jgi:hypothetical protein
MEALLGPHMALVQSAFLSKAPSDAMRSILGVGAMSLKSPPYAEMALVAWSSEKIKTILGGFLFFGRTWLWQNKFIVKKNNMKVFILKIND